MVSFQWFAWGYSLTFSHSAGLFIGDLQNVGFRNTLARPSVGSVYLPDLLFAVYQGMFAAITVALAVGAVAERGELAPYLSWTKHVFKLTFPSFRSNDSLHRFHALLEHSHL